MKCMINHSNNRTKDVKIVYISNLSQFKSEGVRGGGNQIPNFPKFKIVHIILGGGSRNLWTFSTILCLEGSP